jgi:hypothetical protein
MVLMPIVRWCASFLLGLVLIAFYIACVLGLLYMLVRFVKIAWEG